MKKIITIILSGLVILFLTACKDSNPDTELKVNLIGTWNSAIFMENSLCDGRLAKGIIIVETLDDNASKIGNVIIKGETLDLDSNQSCYIGSQNRVSSKFSGMQGTLTANEYLNHLHQINQGDNTIESIDIDSFTDSKIVEKYEYKNGIVLIELLTR